MVMTTSQARRIRKNTVKDSNNVKIVTPTTIIEPSESEKLLGCCQHQDRKFEEHILRHEEALVKSANKKIGALKIVGKFASFKRWVNIFLGF